MWHKESAVGAMLASLRRRMGRGEKRLENWWVPVVLLGYFVPSFVASVRKHPSESAIGLMNLLLGWTVLFWLWSLFWALSGPDGRLAPKPDSARKVQRDNAAGQWQCPWCFGEVDPRAEVCRHCRKPVEPVLPSEKRAPL